MARDAVAMGLDAVATGPNAVAVGPDAVAVAGSGEVVTGMDTRRHVENHRRPMHPGEVIAERFKIELVAGAGGMGTASAAFTSGWLPGAPSKAITPSS